MIEIKKQSLSETFSIYFDIRMLKILLLGAISGFPWVLIGSSLSLWLKEDGLSRSTIGWAGLIFGVYAFNYLWAPLIDRIQIPILTKKIGHRRAWIVLMQSLILICLVLWSILNPTQNLAMVITVGLFIAIASATQDITVDALRIEQIGEHEGKSMAAGAAMAVVGWWSGYKLGGFVCLAVAEKLQLGGVENYWQITFVFLMAIIVLCNVGLNFIPESNKERFENIINTDSSSSNPASLANASYLFLSVGALCFLVGKYFDKIWFTNGGLTFLVIGILFLIFSFLVKSLGENNPLSKTFYYLNNVVANPLSSFFNNNGLKIGLAILAFVFLFKIGEAFLGRMSLVFYKEIGFSKGDIAIFSKALGWVTTIVFTLIGGAVAMRSGIIKTLLIAGIAMAATNILFSVLAWAGPSKSLFALAVILDDLAAAFATVAFVTFISLLVDRNFTATQYALLASVGTAGRTLLASSSGAMVDGLGGDWGLFFVITALMVVPSLICLALIKNKLKLNN